MDITEKVCDECRQHLRCVMTGAEVYLAHTSDTHSADLFACFECLLFYVYGLNMTPLVLWKGNDPKVEVTPAPDVVVGGCVVVTPYGKDSGFAFVTGEVIPLPSAIRYMKEKCHHEVEIGAYLARAGKVGRAAWRLAP